MASSGETGGSSLKGAIQVGVEGEGARKGTTIADNGLGRARAQGLVVVAEAFIF